jgi:hypothetical protein
VTPLPSVPNVIQIRSLWDVTGDVRAETIHHALYSGSAPNAADCVTLAAEWVSACSSHLPAVTHVSTSMTGAIVKDLASSTGAEGQSSSAWTGTETGNSLPSSTAVAIIYSIARRYRGGKPRNMWPFGSDSNLSTGQQWTSGFITSCVTAVAAVFTAFIGQSAGGTTISQMVSVSYYDGFTVVTSPTTGRARNVPKLRSGGPAVDTIVSPFGNTRVGNVRRRLGKQT